MLATFASSTPRWDQGRPRHYVDSRAGGQAWRSSTLRRVRASCSTRPTVSEPAWTSSWSTTFWRGRGFTILGISGGIPGLALLTAGCLTGRGGGARRAWRSGRGRLGRGHGPRGRALHGAFHTSERDGRAYDPLLDTPECTATADRNGDQSSTTTSAGTAAATTSSRPGDQRAAPPKAVTNDQRFVLLRNPSLGGTHDQDDVLLTLVVAGALACSPRVNDESRRTGYALATAGGSGQACGRPPRRDRRRRAGAAAQAAPGHAGRSRAHRHQGRAVAPRDRTGAHHRPGRNLRGSDGPPRPPRPGAEQPALLPERRREVHAREGPGRPRDHRRRPARRDQGLRRGLPRGGRAHAGRPARPPRAPHPEGRRPNPGARSEGRAPSAPSASACRRSRSRS